MLLDVAWWAMVVILSTVLIWWGTSLLETASERLSVYYGLPDIVRGAVIIAVGSSFPELSTVTLSALIHGEFELGVAAIVGSAIFNITVIPALSSLIGRETLDVNRGLVYKEAQFYIISIAALLLVFSFSVIYFPVAGTPGLTEGTINRWLALMPVLLYGLYVFIQYQDSSDSERKREVAGVNLLTIWTKLLGSLLVILVGVELLVRASIEFGHIFDTPSFLWGVTIVAAATSVPDTVMSVRVAREGNPIASVANVFGSNIFDLLVCVPAGVLIAGSATINFTVAAPMMGFLIVATILLFTFMRTDMTLSGTESWGLLLFYVAFIIWLVPEYFEYVDFLPGVPH